MVSVQVEIQDIVKIGYLNGLFVLARSIGLIGHALDQKRLQQPLYRHPWDEVSIYPSLLLARLPLLVKLAESCLLFMSATCMCAGFVHQVKEPHSIRTSLRIGRLGMQPASCSAFRGLAHMFCNVNVLIEAFGFVGDMLLLLL